jgi:hypothetical protein
MRLTSPDVKIGKPCRLVDQQLAEFIESHEEVS